MAERDYGVVVFGATGVTGRRVAAYVARRCAESGERWAAAGRDPDKVRTVLAEEGVKGSYETLAADASERTSLTEMARRARVVCNLVGPYTQLAAPVIEACVAEGSHYLDLTGEIPFVAATIDRHHEQARAARVKVVQVCGFEALPPDLAVALAARTAAERHREALVEVELRVGFTPPPGVPRPSDGISGGTFQSLRHALADEQAQLLLDPASLVPDGAFAARVRQRSPIEIAPRRADGAVVAPMVPSAYLNPPVVHRSRALLAGEGDELAVPLRYREGIALPGGAVSLAPRFAAASAVSGLQAATRLLASAPSAVRETVAAALGRVGPSSGFGPARERVEQWRWEVGLQGRTAGGHEVEVRADAEGHPGYLATARIVGEAALALADPSATPERWGCLTPATALGAESAQRFAAARLWFSVLGPRSS